MKKLDIAMRKSDGTLQDLTEREKIYNERTKEATNRVKTFGFELQNGTKSLADFEKEYKPNETDLPVAPKSLKDSLKGMASSALATVGNLAVGAITGLALEGGIALISKAYDYVVNYDKNIISKGEEAKESIQQQTEAYQIQKNTLTELSSKYSDLSKGIKITGNQIKNISLSNEEFDSFLDTSNQIANIAPSMVKTYDDEGNAILNLGQNTSDINKKIEDYIKLQRDLTHISIRDNIQDQYEGTIKSSEKIQSEMSKYADTLQDIQNQKENLEAIKSAVNGGLFSDGGIYNIEYNDSQKKSLKKLLDDYNIALQNEQRLENGNLNAAIDTTNLSTKSTIDFNKSLSENIQAVDKENSLIQSQIQAQKLLYESKWKELIPSIQSYVDSSNMFDSLASDEADKIKSSINTMISNIDYSAISDAVSQTGSIDEWIDQQLIAPMMSGSKEVKKAWADLFNLEDQRSKISIRDFAKERNEYLKIIAKSQGVSFQEMGARLGYASRNDDGTYTWVTQDEIERAANKTGLGRKGAGSLGEYLNGLDKETYDIAIDIILNGEENISSIQQLQTLIAEMQETRENEKYSLSTMQENVSSASTALSSFSAVLSETTSAGGVSADNIKIINDAFSDLENADLSNLFVNTTNGVKLNIDALKQLNEEQNKIKSNDFAKSIALQEKAIEDYKKNTDEATVGTEEYYNTLKSMYDDLASRKQAQSQWQALRNQQEELFSDYAAWQRATQTANAGDKYTNLVSGLKSAVDAYNHGLVGTDDFKTFAALISPTGATDADNFAENYAKASRYLTEDKTGVLAFLDDLDAKGLAEYNDETERWTYNIKDMANAAQTLGIGDEFLSAMFQRLEDFGFHNNFVSSIEEGESHLSDVTDKLATAQRELAELEAQGANTSAIEAKRKEVNEYAQDVKDTQENISAFTDISSKNVAQQKQDAKSAIETLLKERDEAISQNLYGDNTGAYVKSLEEQIKSIAKEAGITLTANLEVDESSYQKQLDSLGIGSWENPLNMEFEKGSADAYNYANALQKVKEAHDTNSESMQTSLDVLSQYTAEELRGIKLGNGEYDVSGLEQAEDALEAIAKEAGLSSEQAKQLVNVLESVGALKVDNTSLNEFDERIQSGMDKLQEMKAEGKIKIDLDADLSSMSEDELGDRFNELMIIKAQLDPDTSEYDAVVALIENTSLQMKINAQLVENGGDYTIEELQAMEGEEFETVIGCDYSEVEKGKAIVDTLANGQETSVTVKIDETQLNQIVSSQESSQITIDADNEPAKGKIDEAVEYGNDQTATITVEANTSPAISSAAFAVHSINSMQATLPVGADTSGITSAIGSALTGPFSIHVNASVSGLPQQKYTGTMLSPAHSSGTAYNILNLKPAYVNGKVALSKDEKALVNELGMEMPLYFKYRKSI